MIPVTRAEPTTLAEPIENQAEDGSVDKQKFRNMVAKNTMASMIGTIVYLVARVFIPPIALYYVGVDAWGIWSFCFVIINFISKGAFGIINVYVRYSGVFWAKGDHAAIGRLVSTGLALSAPFAVVSLLALWFAMPQVLDYFNIADANRAMAFKLFFGVTAIFMVELTLGAFGSVLYGIQKLVAVNVIGIGAALLESGLMIILLVAGLGVDALMWAFACRYTLGTLVNYLVVRRTIPGMKLGFSQIDKSFFTYFVNFGGVMQINGILNMLTGTLERAVFLKYFGEKANGLLDLGQKFPSMAVFIPMGITTSIYPAVTHLDQKGERDEIGMLYVRGSRYIFMSLGLLMGFMVWFSEPVMGVWLGDKEVDWMPAFFMTLFAFPYQMHGFTGPATSVFKGMGQPFKETLYPILKLTIFGIGLYLAWRYDGMSMISVAIATAVASVGSSMLFIAWSNVKLSVSQLLFMRRAVLPGIMPYLVGLVAYYLTESWWMNAMGERWGLAFRMIPTGLTYVFLCLLVFWFVFFDGGEKESLKKQVRARLGRFIKF